MSNDEFQHDEEAKGADDWAANEPPVDDFGDPAAEAATVSEGVEAAHDESANTAIVEEKKKSPVLLLVIVLVIAAAGAGAYWQFGMKPAENADMAQNNNAPPPLNLNPAPAPAAPDNSAAPTTNFGAAPAPAAAAAAPAMPAPSPASDNSAASNPSPTAGSAAMNGVNVVPPPVAPAMPPAAMGMANNASNANNDARLGQLSTRLDDLEKSLGQTTQQLSQINDKLAAGVPSSGAPAPAQPDAATTDRIDKLEQKVIQLEQHQGSPVRESAEATPPMSSSSMHMTPHASSYAPAHKTHHHERHETVVSSKKAKSGRWILRAATADEVWVAKDSTTREIRPVHVGDKLAGIGTVTAIVQNGDHWVVKGTAGTVR